jgi:hypothetical protein
MPFIPSQLSQIQARQILNDSNTNSSHIMDENRLNQQLQLMANELKPLTDVDMVELQKLYQQKHDAQNVSHAANLPFGASGLSGGGGKPPEGEI